VVAVVAAVTEAEGLVAVAVVAAADAVSNPVLKSNSKLWGRLWPQLLVGVNVSEPQPIDEGAGLAVAFLQAALLPWCSPPEQKERSRPG
jgi:hypothetical protein